MAYAALVSLSHTIDLILRYHQSSIFFPENQQILQHLHGQSTFLQAFLEEFPDESGNLEGPFRDLAYEAEDAIEHIMSKQFLLQLNSTGQSEDVEFPQHQSGEPTVLHEKLQKVTEEIDSVVQEAMKAKNSLQVKDLHLGDSSPASSSSSLAPTSIDKDVIVGFEDDLMAIKTRLCGESSKLQVIPICGMGGIGKTTLATIVYDDPLCVEHFHIRAWVTVSQDYNAENIFSSPPVSIKGSNEKPHGQSSDMAGDVYKSLKGMRYLIVLDDLWSTTAWDDMKRIFPDDNNGSRIISTTRLLDVATYVGSSSPPHQMRFMDADQSWNLLKGKVFKNESCPAELENIGKMIARSCGGLPLAIAVIAGLLSTVSQTQASWQSIAENVNSVVAAMDENSALKILSLSYIHLPHHFRSCFLYMGIFPEDYEIKVSKLIKLWVAEGFLKPSGSKSLEEDAEEYLEDLVKRSLILVVGKKPNGKIKSCKVHDLVRNLCMRKAEEEKFLLHYKNRYVDNAVLESMKDQRRLSVSSDNIAIIYGLSSRTRTILCFPQTFYFEWSSASFGLQKVLDLGYANFRRFPQLFNLFHLRYLAFSSSGDLPASISNLRNLQTLIINPLRRLMIRVSVPSEVWRMRQLRHLVCFCFDSLPNPKEVTFALENLQTLSRVINFECTEEILKTIPNLKKLGISYLRRRKEWSDYHLNNLVHLHQLEKLRLVVNIFDSFRGDWNIVFPTTLKKLTLIRTRLPWKDMVIVRSLPNLEMLKLRKNAFHGPEWETIELQFPQLKFLLIEYSNLEHWITESSHFPSLKHLCLFECNALDEIPDGIGEIPTLELIELDKWNKSLVNSAKQIQEEQQSLGNDTLQILIRRERGLYREIM